MCIWLCVLVSTHNKRLHGVFFIIVIAQWYKIIISIQNTTLSKTTSLMHSQKMDILQHYSAHQGLPMASWSMCGWIRGRRWDWNFLQWNIFTTLNHLTCTHLLVSGVRRSSIQNWRTSWTWSLSFIGYILLFDQCFFLPSTSTLGFRGRASDL